MRRLHLSYSALIAAALGGCAAPSLPPPSDRPTVAPASQPLPDTVLQLDSSGIAPLHRELLPIDLPSALRVALAENLEIRLATEQVAAARGRLESTQGSILPAMTPGLSFEHVDGTVRAVQGNLVGVGFDTFQINAALQLILNPGRVIYDILAARKRLLASEHQERAAILDTLRTTAIEYYELVLAQARLAARRQSVVEARELLRINQSRVRAGAGTAADELRAQARLAEREQDLALNLDAFYRASITLATTLRLDPAVTLVPRAERVAAVMLVRSDLPLETLLGLAAKYRPDLESARAVAAAFEADDKAAWWTALGPQFQIGYQYGGITGHADRVVQDPGTPNNLMINPYSSNGTFSSNPAVNGLIKQQILEESQRLARVHDKTFVFSDQERLYTSAGWRFALSAAGDLRTAGALHRSALLEAAQRFDQVQAEVVRARQTSRTQSDLIPMAARQVAAAQEALRITQANLQAGTMTTLDVLQAEDAAAQARLRYAEAIVRYNQSQVTLAGSLGLFDEKSLPPAIE